MTNNNPSLNPADTGSLAGTLQFAFKRMMQQTDGMLPARVIDFDRNENRVKVQPLITLLTTDGSSVPRPEIASLPVMVMGGGDFVLSFPIKGGDLGWILANDRDISLFLQNYSESPPNTEQIKNFSAGVFIPDVMRNFTIASEDDDRVVLQNLSGTSKISIGETSIKIKTSLLVNIEAPEVDIKSPLVNINPAVPGLLAVNGNITATGTITPGP